MRVLSWAPDFQRAAHSFHRPIRTFVRTCPAQNKNAGDALPLSYTREGFESGICRDLRSSGGLSGGNHRLTAGRLRAELRAWVKEVSR